MSASSRSLAPWRSISAEFQRIVLPGALFVPLLCGLVPVLFYKKVLERVAWQDPGLAMLGAVVLAALCSLFAFVRYVP
jgi:hypothetical protein